MGRVPEDALINYTAEELDGTITAEKQYGEPAGRITIVDEPPTIPPIWRPAPGTTTPPCMPWTMAS